MHWLVPDFETRSLCDLKAAGAWRYAEDPSTEVICIWFEFEDGKRVGWHPGEPLVPRVLDALAQGWMFCAHNAAFEQAMWQHHMVALYGWPPIPLAQWHDTMARCAELALPQKLEKVLPVLFPGTPFVKDKEGSRLTLSLSRCDKRGYLPKITPEIRARVDEYCYSDITNQSRLHQRLGWLTPSERGVWEMNERINQRGIGVDLEFVRAAQQVVDGATVPLAAEFREITGGLNFTQRDKTLAWVRGRGVQLDNMQKETLARILGEPEDEDDETDDDVLPSLPPAVHRALHIRQLVGSASIKKLGAAEACVCSDGRARGLVRYHAASTGRFAGSLLQPHNFPRGTNALIKAAVDLKVDAIKTGDWEFVEMLLGPAVEAVVGSLRHMLIAAPGKVYVSGDYAQIEARDTLALAGQWDKVELFESGADPYCDMATAIYKRIITKADTAERQIGKNSVLGLGFGMGAPKFHNKYAADDTLAFCQEIVDTYRQEWAPQVVELWGALGDASLKCMEDGVPFEAYGCVFERIDRWLTMLLPSGRRLWYDEPSAGWREMPWSTPENPCFRRSWSYKAVKQGKRQTVHAFGGHLTENVAQALARDLLVDAMVKCEANGLPVVLTVHDEILCEVPAGQADETALRDIMQDVPAWAKELRIPVKSETWTGERYRK